MKKTLMITACVAAGLALAACGKQEETPAATDAATDASATTEMNAGSMATPADSGAMSGANGAAPAASDTMGSGAPASGAMSSSTGTPANPTGNTQVPGGVVNSSDPVPPSPGDYSSTNPRPN